VGERIHFTGVAGVVVGGDSDVIRPGSEGGVSPAGTRRGCRTGAEDDASGLGGEHAVPARPEAGKVNCLAGLLYRHGKGGPDRLC
jgi:hypothetical protein